MSSRVLTTLTLVQALLFRRMPDIVDLRESLLRSDVHTAVARISAVYGRCVKTLRWRF
ncbi:MAG: hypothetical protein QW379_10265 [Thermoplasmata archaeon]